MADGFVITDQVSCVQCCEARIRDSELRKCLKAKLVSADKILINDLFQLSARLN